MHVYSRLLTYGTNLAHYTHVVFRPTQLETDKERAMSELVALREEVIITIILYPYILYNVR